MRELVWRCILMRDAATREYGGRTRGSSSEDDGQSSLGGVGGPDKQSVMRVSMRRECCLSWTAKSPIVQGGVSGRWRSWRGPTAVDVGETFMAARSAS